MTKAKTGETHAKSMVEPVAGTMAGRLAALELALDNLPISVGLFHIDGRAIYLNAPFRRLHKITVEKPGTYGFAKLVDSELVAEWADDPRHFFKHLVSTLKTKGALTSQTEIGGRIIAIHDMLLQGNLILSTQMDVSDRVRAEQQVNYLASHDTLTGLANRVTFNTQLENLIEQKKAMRGRFAVMTIDVDRFKDINDTLGHGAGDAILRHVAAKLRENTRIEDFVARIGGDEFVVVCADSMTESEYGELARRLIDAVNTPITYAGHECRVGASIGIAMREKADVRAEQLLVNADIALYEAKRHGRNRVERFTDQLKSLTINTKKTADAILRSLEQNDFVAYFQPQFDAHTLEINGVEALARWQHPEDGILTPDRFLVIAESLNVVSQIDAAILEQALLQRIRWQANDLAIDRVSVNISAQRLFDESLLQRLEQLDIVPGSLSFELLESISFDDKGAAVTDSIERIKAHGIDIEIDDFGTGYSSLSYLQAFPFDTLKIDKSFTSKLWSDHHANEIVRAVIGLGRGLNMPIVAEGVETKEQLEFLRKEQCQSIQGYLIGKPEPIAVYADIVGRPQPAKRPPRGASSRERHRTRVVRAQSI